MLRVGDEEFVSKPAYLTFLRPDQELRYRHGQEESASD